jgi:hypothetical protein
MQSTLPGRHPRCRFSQSEDELLVKAVAELGPGDWYRIARRLSGRNARQCKDRWMSYLSPAVGNAPWTPEEDQLLICMYNELGPLWKFIASFFTARTDTNVKNRWQLMQRRIIRHANRGLAARARAKQSPTVRCNPLPTHEDVQQLWPQDNFDNIWEPIGMNEDNRSDSWF